MLWHYGSAIFIAIFAFKRKGSQRKSRLLQREKHNTAAKGPACSESDMKHGYALGDHNHC